MSEKKDKVIDDNLLLEKSGDILEGKGAQELVELYDPEFRFRRVLGISAIVITILASVLSLFHVYTAGFGILQELKHRAVHLSFVILLVFLLYPIRGGQDKPYSLKYIIYDFLFASFAAWISYDQYRDILNNTTFLTYFIPFFTFIFAIYYKRRETLKNALIPYFDLLFSLLLLLIPNLIIYYLSSVGYFNLKNLTTGVKIWALIIYLASNITLVITFIKSILHIRRKDYRYDPRQIPFFDILLGIAAVAFSSYLIVDYNNLVTRSGLFFNRDIFMGSVAILLILEAARRALGPALPTIAFFAVMYARFGEQIANIPGLAYFAHRNYDFGRIIQHMYLGTEGIYGIPVGVVATYVFHFVLFGIIIQKSGMGKLFMDLALAAAGKSRGGPAKVSVISSGLLGSINGSSIANTVTTGALTIPLMKKIGYRKEYAGAVEATSSTGGQITPPIMGAAAFIMADFLGIPYIKIAAAAIIPALMHYLAIFTMVHLEAKKQDIRGLTDDQIPEWRQTLKDKGLFLLPLVMVIGLLVSGTTPFLAAFFGIITTLSLAQIKGETQYFLVPYIISVYQIVTDSSIFGNHLVLILGVLFMTGLYYFYLKHKKFNLLTFSESVFLIILFFALSLTIDARLASFWVNFAIIAIGVFHKDSIIPIPAIIDALKDGAKNALAIGAACAAVGLIIGATTLTGAGLAFSQSSVQIAKLTVSMLHQIDIFHLFSGFNLVLLFTLIYVMLASIILGSGLPTTATYIILAIITAPALANFGISLLAAHMFVLYYGVLADVTPPVALAAYAGSGIAGSNPFKTGLVAFRLAGGKATVPFAFVYSPSLLLLPWLTDKTGISFPYYDFAIAFASTVIGIFSLAAALEGFLKTEMKWFERLIFIAASVALLAHGAEMFAIGLTLFAAGFFIQTAKSKKLI